MSMYADAIGDIVSQLNRHHGWQLDGAGCQLLCQRSCEILQRNPASNPAKYPDIVINVYHDYATVAAACDPQHPHHELIWVSIMDEILSWYRCKRFSLGNGSQLCEHSPDLVAYENVKRSLPQFRFEARLRSYIHTIAERAIIHWWRAKNAKKLGGSGGRRIHESPNVYTPKPQDQTYYLSQTNGRDCQRELGDTIASPDLLPHEHVERCELQRHMAAEVHAMVDDPLYLIAQQYWYALLCEDNNITALAKQLGLQANELYNLRDRLRRRCKPFLVQWFLA